MKNNLLKYYVAAFYLCSTFVMFADDPGDGGLDQGDGSGDSTGVPIDNYVWVLAIAGLIFVFMKFRTVQNQNKVNG